MKQLFLLSVALLGFAVSTSAQLARPGRSRSGEAATARPAARYVARSSRLGAVRRARTAPSIVLGGSGSPRARRAGARVYQRCAPLAGGRWELRYERVCVPGYWETRAVPAVEGWVLSLCGVRVWGVVTPPRCERLWVPARYEMRQRRVWVRY